MRRRVERELRKLRADGRIHPPAGQPMQVAQQREQGELAQRAQVASLVNFHPRMALAGLYGERHVVRQQAVVAAPAPERQAQRGRRDAGARQQPVAAPGQAAAEPAGRLVVQLVHGGGAQALELRGGHAVQRVIQRRCLNLCLGERAVGAQPTQCVGVRDGPNEGDGCVGMGEWCAVRPHKRQIRRLWRDLQPRCHLMGTRLTYAQRPWARYDVPAAPCETRISRRQAR